MFTHHRELAVSRAYYSPRHRAPRATFIFSHQRVRHMSPTSRRADLAARRPRQLPLYTPCIRPFFEQRQYHLGRGALSHTILTHARNTHAHSMFTLPLSTAQRLQLAICRALGLLRRKRVHAGCMPVTKDAWQPRPKFGGSSHLATLPFKSWHESTHHSSQAPSTVAARRSICPPEIDLGGRRYTH